MLKKGENKQMLLYTSSTHMYFGKFKQLHFFRYLFTIMKKVIFSNQYTNSLPKHFQINSP